MEHWMDLPFWCALVQALLWDAVL
ncbi:predicted protein [Fibroporia radiculosa]|uniref:Uncharacterized protein n=1 Tax=Fibroporia radiculosa TaxID=599839 RepID=J7S668_9APHY|nr:predicted protein [Fibroporia radiculosa]